MTQYWNTQGIAPAFEPEVSSGGQIVPITTAPEQSLEDTTMIRGLLGKVGDYLVERTELAKRVAELEAKVRELEHTLATVMADAEVEKQAHVATRASLAAVREDLEHEQRVTHDLVMERDIVVEERNKAQQERDEARKDRDEWCVKYNDIAFQLESEKQRSAVCEERASQMAARIEALKSALSGLQSL